MQKLCLAIFCLFLISSSFAIPSIDSTNCFFEGFLSKQQALKDLELVKIALLEAHPGLTLYQSKQEFEKQIDKLQYSLPDKVSIVAFFESISQVVASIRCGHTSIQISKQQMEKIQRIDAFFPFPLKIIDSRAWIDLSVELNGKNMLGVEVVSINGVSTKKILHLLTSLVTTDGNNKTLPVRYIEDHFYLYYFIFFGFSNQFDLKIIDWTNSNTSSSFLNLRSQNIDAYQNADTFAISSVSKQTVLENYKNRSSLSLFYKRADQTSLTFLKDKHIAILNLASFDNDELKKEKIHLKRFLKKSFKKITKNKTNSLVIDLRQNTGGDEGNEDLLLSYLVSKSYRKYKSVTINDPNYSFFKYTDFSKKWKKRKYKKKLKKEYIRDSLGVFTRREGYFKPIKIRSPVFGGKLYVLLSGKVFSGASEFITLLDQNRQAEFIGQESGGNYYANTSGEYIMVSLPESGFELTIPLCLYRLWVNKTPCRENTFEVDKRPLNHGLIPKHEVSQTLIDLKNGKDTVIDYALKLIEKQK